MNPLVLLAAALVVSLPGWFVWYELYALRTGKNPGMQRPLAEPFVETRL